MMERSERISSSFLPSFIQLQTRSGGRGSSRRRAECSSFNRNPGEIFDADFDLSF